MDLPLAIYQRMTAVIPYYSAPAGFGRVALPLAGDDGRIRHILGATSFDAPVIHGRGTIATRPELDRRSDISALAGTARAACASAGLSSLHTPRGTVFSMTRTALWRESGGIAEKQAR